MKTQYALFCKTHVGNCVCLVEADSTEEAETEAKNHLIGDDIDDIEIVKVERIGTGDGCAIFWDNELEEL